MKAALLSILLTFFVVSKAASAAIYLIPPENSKTYQEITDKVESVLKQKLGDGVDIIKTSDNTVATKEDLLVLIGGKHDTAPSTPTIYSFNLNPNNEQRSTSEQWATININQPIEKLLSTAQKTVIKNYKKNIVVIISDKNTSTINKLNTIKSEDNLKIITIGDNEVAAKKIEPELAHAAAIVAVYDPAIWSGNSARWIIQQAYNYKVPIIGYSKAFLKAGAMVSVYSTAEQIIEETTREIEQWVTTKKLSNNVSYPNYMIKVNENIAKALNFDRLEIIEIGKKQ